MFPWARECKHEFWICRNLIVTRWYQKGVYDGFWGSRTSVEINNIPQTLWAARFIPVPNSEKYWIPSFEETDAELCRNADPNPRVCWYSILILPGFFLDAALDFKVSNMGTVFVVFFASFFLFLALVALVTLVTLVALWLWCLWWFLAFVAIYFSFFLYLPTYPSIYLFFNLTYLLTYQLTS